MNYDVFNWFIDNAISFATRISRKYEVLKFLELNGLIDMFLYEQKKKELKKLLDEEKEFYDSFLFVDDELDYMISYIVINYNIDENLSLEDILHNPQNGFNPAFRVLFKLDNLTNNYFETLEDEIIEEELLKHVKFQKNLIKNYCLVIENFVNSYLLNEQNYHDELLYIKYLLPFINSEIEFEFMEGFKFNKDLYLDYKIYGDFFGMSEMVQDQYICLQLFNKFVDEINDVLEIDDKIFFQKEKRVLISEIILKSISVFFSNEFIEESLEDLNEHIIRNAVCFSNNQLAVQNIFNLGEITKKDKQRFAYLSLRLPRN